MTSKKKEDDLKKIKKWKDEPINQNQPSFPYISSPGDRNFKILVSTPHNTPLIMGDRHKNVEDPMTWTRDIRKTKFHLVSFFFTHPLISQHFAIVII